MTTILKPLVVAAVVLVAAASVATTARADFLKGDPRDCRYHRAQTCLLWSARETTRAYMAKVKGVPKYYGMTICSMKNGPLVWSCFLGLERKTATVKFVATSSGWRRLVTVQ